MDAWINEIAEATGIGCAGLDFSLADMGSLVPDARVLCPLGAAIAFCLVAGCREAWSNGHQDSKSDTERK